MNGRVRYAIGLAALLLGACSTASEPVWKKAIAGDGPGQLSRVETTPEAVRNLPKSRSGNRSEYEVFGIRYAVLESARGFVEQGTASWYGSKFHGNATASGEIYDMHQLTAAHKHLPLPTFVRVTRLDNGQSIVVKVNDRGPFVGDRIIDLSYASAAALDMLDSGKAEVRVEAISHHEQIGLQSQHVQVGAFGDVGNAQSLMRRISSAVQLPVWLDSESAPQVYRVQVGPLQDDMAVKGVMQMLALEGINGYPVRKTIR